MLTVLLVLVQPNIVNAEETIAGLPLLTCVNAGGQSYTANDGSPFIADTHFLGGSSATSSHDIIGSVDDILYNSERWGDFSYAIPVPAFGDYSIQLYFAEVYYGSTASGGAGSRVFDISIEGQVRTPNFDIIAEVGALTPIRNTYTTVVTDDALNITFGIISDFPKISAICVYSGINVTDTDGDGTPDNSDAFPSDPSETMDTDGDGVGDNADAFPNDSSEVSDLDSDGVGDNTDTDIDGDGVNNGSDAFPYDPNESMDSDNDGIGDNGDSTPYAANSSLISCINVGGSQYVHSDGRVFVSDQFFSGGNVGSANHEIEGTVDDVLFQTERWRDFSYSIPTAVSGVHTVELLFSEIYYQATTSSGGPGSRVFDVLIEGGVVENNLDIISAVASKTALQKLYPIDVTDGVVNIDFGVEVDWPKLSAVCLYSGLKFADADADGVADDVDAFPNDASESADSDGDGVGDNADALPNDASETSDIDNDGIGDNTDLDIDGDGVLNEDDALPYDPLESVDSDGDGWGDNSDTDPQNPNFELVSCVNSGGSEYSASSGINYSADRNFIGGNVASQPFVIANTLEDELYQSERWGDFQYSIPVSTPHVYTLELQFAEIYYGTSLASGGSGSRVFDVVVEDSVVRTSYDIMGNQASQNAVIEQVVVSVNDGALNLQFNAVTDWPKLSAYCVYKGLKLPDQDNDGVPDASDAFPIDPTEQKDSDGDGVGDNSDAFPNDASESSDLDADGIGDNSDADIDGDGVDNAVDVFPYDANESVDTDGDGFGDNGDVQPTIVNFDVVSCINVGGGEFNSSNGVSYSADQYGSGGDTASAQYDIADTVDDEIYQTERWGEFSYNIPLVNSKVNPYTIELKFVENYYQASIPTGGVGSRIFDVLIDGNVVDSDLDIFDRVGSKTALINTYFTNTSAGSINIDLQKKADWATLSGICVYLGIKPVDSDDDGVSDNLDAFPNNPLESADSDLDGVGDNADLFPNDPSETTDLDGDGVGDNSDPDLDGDGYLNDGDAFPSDPTEWLDTDGDTIGDNADPDPLVAAPALIQCINAGGPEYITSAGKVFTGDQFFFGGNASDTDLNITNSIDPEVHRSQRWGNFVYNIPVEQGKIYTLDLYFSEAYWGVVTGSAAGSRLFDVLLEDRLILGNFDQSALTSSGDENHQTIVVPALDGSLDLEFRKVKDFANVSAICISLGSAGIDTDGDGLPDEFDQMPYDASEYLDSDYDGIGDNADLFPNDVNESMDSDGDGIGDESDLFPFDASVSKDLDGDGVGDAIDIDRDGDGVDNDSDAFPDDARVSLDTDSDGVGDALDADPNDPLVSLYSPYFDVTFVQGTGQTTSLAMAEQVISASVNLVSTTVQTSVVDFKDTGVLDGQFPGGTIFPIDSPVVVDITRQINISSSGKYTFLLRSDGGIRMTVDGQVIIEKSNAQTQDDLYGVIELSVGMHDIHVLYFETAQDSTLEIMAAKGDALALYSHPNSFALLTDRVEAELESWPVLDASIGGTWGSVIQWPQIPVSTVQMPDGRLLTWSGGGEYSIPGESTFSSVYDPQSGLFVESNHETHNLFCSGISLMENGNVAATGGNNIVTQFSEFDINTLQWMINPEMNHPRWYPTQMTMPDNRVFTTFAMGAGNTSEVFSHETGQWVETPGANQQVMLNESNIINTYPVGNGSSDMQWYGFMHVAPNGKVFQSGPTQTMQWFTPDGQGSAEIVGPRIGGDQARMFGSAVMYDIGKILVTGGNDQTKVQPSSDTAITVELNGAAPVVKEGRSMHYRRTFQDGVVLPDGKVLVIGGTTDGILFSDEGSILQPEIWDPVTGSWTLVSSHTVPRNYHSTAVLMKDATVFSGGGGACNGCDADHQDAQIYTPAYLYNNDGTLAARPIIFAGPSQAQAGDRIAFTASVGVTKFNMIRLQGTTHSINTDQRFIPINFEVSGSDYQLDMNANTNVLIPGYYWVFALDSNGVPSVGRTIQIVRDPSGIDTDGDGIPDDQDLFPNDPAEGTDQDGDGVGDNADAFPTDPNETADSDFDGVGDNADAFPADGLETIDSDGDGYGDNRDAYPLDSTRFAAPRAVVRNSTPIIVIDNVTGDSIWNVNPDNNSVSVSNAGLSAITEIGVGNHPAALAFSPLSGELFVSNKGDASISVIDTVIGTVARQISLPAGSKPHGLVVSPDGTHLYVALEALGTVQKIDVATDTVVASIELGGKLRHLAVSSDGLEIYVTNFVTPPLQGESTANIDVSSGGGEFYVLNANTLLVSARIELGYANRGVTDVAGPGMPNYLNAPVVSPNGLAAYIPSKQDNILSGALRGGTGMNFDQTVRAVTSIVNLQDNTENPGARIQHDNAGLATGAAFSGTGQYLYVALETSREVAIYDTQGVFEVTRINVGLAPQGVATSSDGTKLYVYSFMSRSVEQFDLSQLLYAGSSSIPLISSGLMVSAETLSPTVKQGKQLFYDAADDRLALDNYMSCGSCHNEGADDGRVWDLTGMGEGLRNTISLLGKGQSNGLIHWSGNFDEVQDFELQIRSLAGGTGLMSDVDFAQTEDTLGAPKAGISTDLDAMAAYVASLINVEASPIRNVTLSALAQQGRTLFGDKGCASCHSGTKLTDSPSGARHDVGTIKASSGSRLSGTLDGLDVPSLYMLWGSAPYLHDGSADTIGSAITAHTTINIDESEMSAIERFLKELQPGDI